MFKIVVRLSELMNGYLGAIIDNIVDNGGDIVEFAGWVLNLFLLRS